MSGTAALKAEAGAVSAGLHYTVDTGVKPVNETFGPNNIRRRVSGEHEVRLVTIRNGRPLAHEFEVEALVKKVSGATRVVVFDHTLRSGDEAEREAKLVREPVLNVHNDYTEWSGPQRVRELLPDEAENLLRRRFAIIQVWRATSKPIQSNPLAIADACSLASKDLIRAERRYPHRVGETYRIGYNPEHRWFYFPRMRRDEALVFKVFDSAKDGRARFTAHSSFNDPNTPAGAPPRQSIEARTLAFFD